MSLAQANYYVREKARKLCIHYHKANLMTLNGGQDKVIIPHEQIKNRLLIHRDKVMYISWFVMYQRRQVAINIH